MCTTCAGATGVDVGCRCLQASGCRGAGARMRECSVFAAAADAAVFDAGHRGCEPKAYSLWTLNLPEVFQAGLVCVAQACSAVPLAAQCPQTRCKAEHEQFPTSVVDWPRWPHPGNFREQKVDPHPVLQRPRPVTLKLISCDRRQCRKWCSVWRHRHIPPPAPGSPGAAHRHEHTHARRAAWQSSASSDTDRPQGCCM